MQGEDNWADLIPTEIISKESTIDIDQNDDFALIENSSFIVEDDMVNLNNSIDDTSNIVSINLSYGNEYFKTLPLNDILISERRRVKCSLPVDASIKGAIELSNLSDWYESPMSTNARAKYCDYDLNKELPTVKTLHFILSRYLTMIVYSETIYEGIEINDGNIYDLMQYALYGDGIKKHLHLFIKHCIDIDKLSTGTVRNYLLYLKNVVKFLQSTQYGISNTIENISYDSSYFLIDQTRRSLRRSHGLSTQKLKSRESLVRFNHWPKSESVLTLQEYVLEVEPLMNSLNFHALNNKVITAREYIFALK
jgi:hypothetical protein